MVEGSTTGQDRSWGKSKGKGKRRVHIEQLKLRTHCWSCETSAESAPARGQKKERVIQALPELAHPRPLPKTGFFVVRDEAMSADASHQFSEPLVDPPDRIFWLKKFVEERKKALYLTDRPSDESEYNAASSDMQFCGMATGSEVGVVDTGAEGGLVGIHELQQLEHRLEDHGLSIKWVPKKSSAKGLGGQAQVVGVAVISLGIVKIGVLEVTVVEGEVRKAIVDFLNFKFIFPEERIELPLRAMPSGHVTIDIWQFAPDGFSTPSTAADGFVCKRDTRAMLAQFDQVRSIAAQVSDPLCRLMLSALFPHAVHSQVPITPCAHIL